MVLNSFPSMARPSSVRMLHSLAMALAVVMLSPVIILTTIPAFWHFLTASGTPGRQGSLIPVIVRQTRPSEGISSSSASNLDMNFESTSLKATQIVLRLPSAMPWIVPARPDLSSAVSLEDPPLCMATRSHWSSTISDAPFQNA